MTVAARRAELATAITNGLDDIKVDPYKSPSQPPFTGWLQINQTDTEACTLGEVRLTVECLILVATDRTDFEKVQDVLTLPLIEAINGAGGRAVVVEPAEITVDRATLYCLSATFVTESEVA